MFTPSMLPPPQISTSTNLFSNILKPINDYGCTYRHDIELRLMDTPSYSRQSSFKISKLCNFLFACPNTKRFRNGLDSYKE